MFKKTNIKINKIMMQNSLHNNDLKSIKFLLGHSFKISGRVIHGKKNGTKIGIPTANLIIHKNFPLHGVFVSKTIISTQIKEYPSITNVGFQPTFSGISKQLEVHLLNTQINLYGKYITVIFLKKIRNEQKFLTVFDLKNQISQDIENVKFYFNKTNNKHKQFETKE